MACCLHNHSGGRPAPCELLICWQSLCMVPCTIAQIFFMSAVAATVAVVQAVVSDIPNCGGVQYAQQHGMTTFIFPASKNGTFPGLTTEQLVQQLTQELKVDFVLLAGYLKVCYSLHTPGKSLVCQCWLSYCQKASAHMAMYLMHTAMCLDNVQWQHLLNVTIPGDAHAWIATGRYHSQQRS
eukprot:GHRR01025699.1.p1 GENE.GHRR01025699.1~~GHRR01025699.1.p1  ORF type:complete len:182 (+),score=37.10 GHRR01025699.1:182-727(+)